MGCASSKTPDDYSTEVEGREPTPNLVKDFMQFIREELNDVRNSRRFSPTAHTKRRLIDCSVFLLLLLILGLLFYGCVLHPTKKFIVKSGSAFNSKCGEFKQHVKKLEEQYAKVLAVQGDEFRKMASTTMEDMGVTNRRVQRGMTVGKG
eukprot:343670_1